MAQDCLNRFVIDAQSVQVRCGAAPESVPTVPFGKGIIPLELMALRLVFLFWFPANRATRKRRSNRASHEIV